MSVQMALKTLLYTSGKFQLNDFRGFWPIQSDSRGLRQFKTSLGRSKTLVYGTFKMVLKDLWKFKTETFQKVLSII